MFSSLAFAQSDSLFRVENHKKQQWPAAEADRIYLSVCEVVAREVRPEHPPILRPTFVLVLGADKDQLLQENQEAKLYLRSWKRESFAEGVVMLAVREVLKGQDVLILSRRALSHADAIIPVAELQASK